MILKYRSTLVSAAIAVVTVMAAGGLTFSGGLTAAAGTNAAPGNISCTSP